MKQLKAEAVQKGHKKAKVDTFLRTARVDPKLLKADRSQGIFRLTFSEFAARPINSNCMSNGKKNMQKKLKTRGHDVGKVDGILGAKTRAAVQAEQIRLGFPADAWPTAALLAKL